MYFVVLPDCAIIQCVYLNTVDFDCKTKLCLIVPGREGKYIFIQESFSQQGILNDINEQDTSFLDCKHNHMMKIGASPDKVGVLYCLLPIKFHTFTSRVDFKGLSLFALGLSNFFRWYE